MIEQEYYYYFMAATSFKQLHVYVSRMLGVIILSPQLHYSTLYGMLYEVVLLVYSLWLLRCCYINQ